MSGSGFGNESHGGQRASSAPSASAAGDWHGSCLSLTPQLRPNKAHARSLRDSLLEFYRLRDVAEQLRSEETAAGADLKTRMAWASVIHDLDGWISEYRRELKRIARRGGCGVKAVKS